MITVMNVVWANRDAICTVLRGSLGDFWSPILG